MQLPRGVHRHLHFGHEGHDLIKALGDVIGGQGHLKILIPIVMVVGDC